MGAQGGLPGGRGVNQKKRQLRGLSMHLIEALNVEKDVDGQRGPGTASWMVFWQEHRWGWEGEAYSGPGTRGTVSQLCRRTLRTGSLLDGRAAVPCPSIPACSFAPGAGTRDSPSWLLWLWRLTHWPTSQATACSVPAALAGPAGFTAAITKYFAWANRQETTPARALCSLTCWVWLAHSTEVSSEPRPWSGGPPPSLCLARVKWKWKWKSLSCVQLFETPWPVHGILQARMLEWEACPLLQRIFPTQESNRGLLHRRQLLYQLSYQGSPVQGRGFNSSGPLQAAFTGVSAHPHLGNSHGSYTGVFRLGAEVVTPGEGGSWWDGQELKRWREEREHSKVSEVCVGTRSQPLLYSIHKLSGVNTEARLSTGGKVHHLTLRGGKIKLGLPWGTSVPLVIPQVQVHFCVSNIVLTSSFGFPVPMNVTTETQLLKPKV